jgi:hypothetical protein
MYFIKNPYLQLPETDGITIMWETDKLSTSEVLIWEAHCPNCGDVQYTPQGESKTFCGGDGYIHKVKVFGLESGKDYCYQVISGTNETKLKSDCLVFRTKSQKDGVFSFAITSETGGSGSPIGIIERLVESIIVERPDFLLFIGDMVNDGRQKKDWDDFLFTPFRHLLHNTPFFLCAGNHEGHADYMKDFLATSENGFYDFDYGCTHFVALDSTQLADHIDTEDTKELCTIELTQNLTPDNPQVQFLINSLSKSNSKWKFVFFHYPPYFSGTWEAKVLRPLCRIFEEYNVDMVFTSHAIVYERSHPIRNDAVDFSNGVRYVVVGGAGEQPKWFHHKKAWHTAKSRAVPHFVHISVTLEQIEFQAIDLDGTIFDSFSIQK